MPIMHQLFEISTLNFQGVINIVSIIYFTFKITQDFHINTAVHSCETLSIKTSSVIRPYSSAGTTIFLIKSNTYWSSRDGIDLKKCSASFKVKINSFEDQFQPILRFE